jgi:hypothetical protein
VQQQSQGDKRGHVLVCHGPSCSLGHGGILPGNAEQKLVDCNVQTGGCLGMCPVGPNAIVRRTAIEDNLEGRRINKDDSILCGIADVDELVVLAQKSLASEVAPRLLKGSVAPKNLRR